MRRLALFSALITLRAGAAEPLPVASPPPRVLPLTLTTPTATATSDRASASRPRVFAAVTAGVVTALVPLAVGAMVLSLTDPLQTRNAGVYVLEAGFVLAPLVAHAVLGEWRRGLIYSILPLASFGSLVALLQVAPGVVDNGLPDTRLLFGGLLAMTLYASAAGVMDCINSGSTQKGARWLAVTPHITSDRVGLALGGIY